MIGQAISVDNKKYNVIILAAGSGSRMGVSSEFIPKALTKLGNKRAIDYIISRYMNVAYKFIIGTGYHADLLKSYVTANYHYLNIDYDYHEPSDIRDNDWRPFAHCLDTASSKYGTIVVFCDLLPVSNFLINDNSVLIATKNTKGNVGTFRHSVSDNKIIKNSKPINIHDDNNGVLGTFIFGDTPVLKSITYGSYYNLIDITESVVSPYNDKVGISFEECNKVFEFGNMDDINRVRSIWEG